MLPTFLGLGGMRCGSTWLHQMLDKHPDICVPSTHKEVDFFGSNYEKGIEWYSGFFQEAAQCGEVCSSYLTNPVVPERVQDVLPDARFIVILRNPVARAISHWQHVLMHHENLGFSEFLTQYPEAITMGTYHQHLERWFSLFDRDHFCILIFEEVMQDKKQALQTIASFLEVPPNGFDLQAAQKEVNAARKPRMQSLYRLAIRVRSLMNRPGLGWLAHLATALRIPRFVRAITLSTDKPNADVKEVRQLYETFREPNQQLEELLDRRISAWHHSSS